MKITSTVYANQTLKFGKDLIEFKNGAAEVSDELFEEIQSSGFPNIYAEGKNPGVKSKASADFDKTLKEVNTEYMAEIDRLKRVNEAKTQELKETKQQLENLKVAYDKDIKELHRQLAAIASNPTAPAPTAEETKAAELNKEEEAVRKDLESMKLPELMKIAIDQEADPELIKKSTKKELIDIIMSKND